MAEEDTKDWREQHLPEEMRGEASLKDIPDVPALAKSYIHAQGMVGADKVVIPGADASDEERSAFFTKLGRPETEDKYEIQNPENMPKDFPLSKELVKGFRTIAHKTGLTMAQVKDIYNWRINSDITAFNNAKAATEEAVASATRQMRTAWGAAFDTKVDSVETVINTYATEEEKNYLKETGVNNDPRFISFMGKVAENFSEATLYGDGHKRFDVLTPEIAQARIAELKGNKEFMAQYQNKDASIRAEAVKRMEGLYILAYPTSEKPK